MIKPSLKTILLMLLTILLSSIAYNFVNAAHSIWWLAWVAPLPILLFGYRKNTSWWQVLLVAFAALFIGNVQILVAYWHTLVPILPLSQQIATQSAEFACCFLLTYFILRYNNSLFTIFAFPACIATLEFIRYFHGGSFGSVAYSQIQFPYLLQTASLGGFTAVTFLVSLFSSGLAYFLIHFNTHTKVAYAALTVTITIIAGFLIFGYINLHKESPRDSVKIGIINTRFSSNISARLNPNNTNATLKTLLPLISKAKHQGAKIILTPEESLSVKPKDQALLQKYFSHIAKSQRLYLIIGVAELISNQNLLSWDNAKR